MAPTLRLRPRPEYPDTSIETLNTEKKIAFRHPGYPDDFYHNVLLYLHAFDASGGLHHITAVRICGIIAGNSFDGYLASKKNDGSQQLEKIELGDDEILRKDEYYFCIPSFDHSTDPYPIYPYFEHWVFPHNSIPHPFSENSIRCATKTSRGAPPSSSGFSPAIMHRDSTCLLTNASDYLQAAHLCPRSQAQWFRWNTMSRYNKNATLTSDWVTHDVRNGIALRPDIHTAFDDKKFALVPKEKQWVPHFFGLTNDLGSLHHNQKLELPSEVHGAFLLVRLAWTIFPLLTTFLEAGPARKLTVQIGDEGSIREEVRQVIPSELPSLDLASNRMKSKSRSPRKRDRPREVDIEDCDQNRTLKTQCTEDKEEDACSKSIDWDDSEDDTHNGLSTHQEQTLSTQAKPWDLHTCSGDSNHSLVSIDTLDVITAPNSTVDSRLIRETKEYNRYIEAIKENWIRKNRPKDPKIFCCNYDQAEYDSQRGVPADPKKGGRYLCPECLGFEYPRMPGEFKKSTEPELRDGIRDSK